jgi:hypothetical protein
MAGQGTPKPKGGGICLLIAQAENGWNQQKHAHVWICYD